MSIEYNRYSPIKNYNGYGLIPFPKLPESSTDKHVLWKEGSRMDKLANKYYGSPFFDFIILLGNPEYVSEFDIPYNTYIRIPFPLKLSKQNYETILAKLTSEI